MKTKKELAEDAVQARFDLKGRLMYGDIYEQGFIAGYVSAEQRIAELEEALKEANAWIEDAKVQYEKLLKAE